MGVHDTDRVQPVKWESTAEGGSSDEGYPSGVDPQEDALEVRGLFGAPATGSRDEEVYIIRDGDNWKFRDKTVTTEKTLEELLAGGGITENQHEHLDTLVHMLDETNYFEVTRSGGKITNAIHWTDSGKTVKVREVAITRSAGVITQVDVIQYDGSGVEVMRATGVITRSSGRVSSIQWTKTVS